MKLKHIVCTKTLSMLLFSVLNWPIGFSMHFVGSSKGASVSLFGLSFHLKLFLYYTFSHNYHFSFLGLVKGRKFFSAEEFSPFISGRIKKKVLCKGNFLTCPAAMTKRRRVSVSESNFVCKNKMSRIKFFPPEARSRLAHLRKLFLNDVHTVTSCMQLKIQFGSHFKKYI